MAQSDPDHLARIHALWTLEGLHAIDPAFLRQEMKDSHPQVRIAAIRAGETLYKQGDKSLVPDVLALNHDPDPNVVIQTMMTAHLLNFPDAIRLIESDITNSTSVGVGEIGRQLIRPPARAAQQLSAADRRLFDHGAAIFKELCFACHGPDGKGMPMPGGKPGETIAPPLGGSQTATGYRDAIISVVLKGLAGPVKGQAYTAGMVPMESNNDEWIASVASYVRQSFGNRAGVIDPRDVARVRAAIKDRTEPWTLDELRAVMPKLLTGRAQWKVSASHRSDMARLAIDGSLATRYDSGVSQAPGQWFQIELPQETLLAGLELNAASSTEDYPRGYKVQLSDDGQSWGPPVASGKGDRPLTDIHFPPAKAKFVRITQTGSVDGLFWSIHELRLFQPGAPAKNSSTTPKKPANAFE
jgi:mono/diheme cytochrome c family protein